MLNYFSEFASERLCLLHISDALSPLGYIDPFDVSAAHAGLNLRHDGKLKFYHAHLGEFLDVTYEEKGQLVPEAMERINYFMRSRGDNKTINMNPDLIRLVDHLQDHFKAETVVVISGYRSPEFNKSLKKSGRNVADNSSHMSGIAMDIHFDEIDESKLAKYAWSLNRGGVGYYPHNLMVHVDLGHKRKWQEGKFTDRLNIGQFTDAPVKMRTDHLFYTEKKRMRLILSKPQTYRLAEFLTLEKWSQGQWIRSGEVALSAFAKPQTMTSGDAVFKLVEAKKGVFEGRGPELAIPYGKFRWKVLTEDGKVQYSNEFYFKRK